MQQAVVVDIVRTASGRGKPGGALHGVHPADLLAGVIRALTERTGVDPDLIDDVIVGCVSQAGEQTGNIARTAALVAGLPDSVAGSTVDRQCGSGQQAVHFAAQGVMAGVYDVVIAGGVESMSRVPMGSSGGGQNPFRPLSVRFRDGLVNQGVAAELIATRWKLDRDRLDEFAAESHRRASFTAAAGAFRHEIVPVALEDGRVHDVDETVRPGTTVDRLAQLGPSFYDEQTARRFPEVAWSVTPGNSSPLTDGASAALIMSADMASKLGIAPRARLVSFSVTGSDPVLMLTGVIPATHQVLQRSGLSIGSIDVFEVNEAFASVPLAWLEEFDVDPERLNPRGGAIALGHPLGASGTRLLSTLINTLESDGARYGLQTMCEGGGMANALIVERL